MSELITNVDIKNWRLYYLNIPFLKMTGVDLFVLSCLDTIEALGAVRDTLKDEVDQLKAQLDQVVLKMITPELEACQAERAAARDELAYMRQQRDGWMNSYKYTMAELKTLKDEFNSIDQVGFAEFQKSQKLQSELKEARAEVEKLRADLAAADDRFIMKVGLEIAKTAYEKAQNETPRAENEKLREALGEIKRTTQLAFDYDHIGSEEFKVKYPDWQGPTREIFMNAASGAYKIACTALGVKLKASEETEMKCQNCGEVVCIEDGQYTCKCHYIPVILIRECMAGLPKFWVNTEVQP